MERVTIYYFVERQPPLCLMGNLDALSSPLPAPVSCYPVGLARRIFGIVAFSLGVAPMGGGGGSSEEVEVGGLHSRRSKYA